MLVPMRHFFALSPSSTRRRMASGRDRSRSFCLAIHVSIALRCRSCILTKIPVPGPVVLGRPTDLFAISRIDFPIN